MTAKHRGGVLLNGFYSENGHAGSFFVLRFSDGVNVVNINGTLGVTTLCQVSHIAVNRFTRFTHCRYAWITDVSGRHFTLLLLIFVRGPGQRKGLYDVRRLQQRDSGAVRRVDLCRFAPGLTLATALTQRQTINRRGTHASHQNGIISSVLGPHGINVTVKQYAMFPARVVHRLVHPPVTRVRQEVNRRRVNLRDQVTVVRGNVHVVSPRVNLSATGHRIRLHRFPYHEVKVLAVS